MKPADEVYGGLNDSPADEVYCVGARDRVRHLPTKKTLDPVIARFVIFNENTKIIGSDQLGTRR